MIVKLGAFNTLKVVKTVDFGVYLDGDEEGEILLPTRYVPEGTAPDDMLRVFLYLDNEERMIATTLEPKIQVGQFAYLQVAWTNQFGAFLDWGLMKDLFVPFSEQRIKMEQGNSYIVYCRIDDESNRIVATGKIEHYLSHEIPEYTEGEEVNILVWQKTDLGFKAIVENKFAGLIYDNEIFRPLKTGDQLTAFIKPIREDGKIDLILQKQGYEPVDDFADQFYSYLQQHEGSTTFNDKSSPTEIYDEFKVSKKVFKKAIGELYKRHYILIDKDCIKLTSKPKQQK
jgi:uncharacterized protein